MKSDRVYVVLPKHFKHGKSTLLWALRNVAKNGERLFIVHVHRHKHISPKALEKIGEYVSMCKEWKVSCASCPLQITKNDDVAKELAELIDRHGITKLVMRGAAGKHYSKGMKSLKFKTAIKLKKTAPLTCKIWFTCNMQLICTREANATVPAIQPPPVDSHALKMAKKKTHTAGRASSHTKAKGPSQRSRNERGAKKRLQERKDTEKSYQLDLRNAKKEKLRFEKQIEELESVIKFLKERALQGPEAAVKNDQQSAMTLPAETVNTDFSKDVIEESKKCLGNTLIGEGGSGSSVVYKGLLHNTTHVAIKIMHPESMQGESDFIRKVAVLGRVRHPNLVTLIGVSKEVFGLVYEFLPNGSLQDKLVAWRNGTTAPLKWQLRIKIIRQIWTVLTFLHSSKPPLVHGNLKASKVLLDLQDSNLACKVEAFGISQSSTGEPTATKADDVRSFGTIALQLLMARLSPEEDAVKVVDEAKEKGELELDAVLNITAWDWPPEVAKRLAHIGLRCVFVGMRSAGLECPAEDDDDLAEEVRQLLVAADRLAAASQEEAEAQAPRQFYCPLSQDLMVDPHIAADAQTYEGDYIKTSFHYSNTSPVTKKTLRDKKLIPNLALKSLMEDWKEAQQRQVRPTPTLTVPVLQGHPTVPPPVAQSQSQPPTPTGLLLHPDPPSVTSGSLTPIDDTSASAAEARLELQPPPVSSSPPTTLTSSSTADARSSSTLIFLPPTGVRRRRVNGRLSSSSAEAADVPGPGETS